MKKACIFLILLSFLLLGCHRKCYELPLSQEASLIIKIELSEHTSGKRAVLCALNPSDVLLFMEKLEAVSCYRYFNDPATDNGYLSVYLYYKNGDIDILGTGICNTTSDSSSIKGWYYLDAGDTWELFSYYIPVEHLPPKK